MGGGGAGRRCRNFFSSIASSRRPGRMMSWACCPRRLQFRPSSASSVVTEKYSGRKQSAAGATRVVRRRGAIFYHADFPDPVSSPMDHDRLGARRRGVAVAVSIACRIRACGSRASACCASRSSGSRSIRRCWRIIRAATRRFSTGIFTLTASRRFVCSSEQNFLRRRAIWFWDPTRRRSSPGSASCWRFCC